MTVNIEIFEPKNYSFGQATLSRVDDVLAIDFDSSRNLAVNFKDGYFRAELSLLDQPGLTDWYQLEFIQGGSQGFSWNISDKLNYGVIKWLRFTLLDKSRTRQNLPPNTSPTIQWRNIKNTRIVSSETELEVLATALRTLSLMPNESEEYSLDGIVRRLWFNGDDWTKYSVESSDSTIVSATIGTRYRYPRDERERIPDRIRIAAQHLAGRTATVTVDAVDAAGNTATLEIEVNVV